MIRQPKRLPPRPVLAAMAVLTVGYAATIPDGPWTDVASVTASVVATAIAAALIYGLRRASPLARGLVVLAMASNLIAGLVEHAWTGWLRVASMVAALAVAALLLVPRSSRQWFAGPAVDSTATPVPASDQRIDTEALWEETGVDRHR